MVYTSNFVTTFTNNYKHIMVYIFKFVETSFLHFPFFFFLLLSFLFLLVAPLRCRHQLLVFICSDPRNSQLSTCESQILPGL